MLTRLNQKLLWIFTFTFFNLPLTWLIALRYLPHANPGSLTEIAYIFLVFTGHLALLVLILALPALITSTLLPRKLAGILAILWASGLQLFLLVDTYIFDLYRFHFSNFILDLLLNAGGDVFSFSWVMWLLAIAAIVTMTALQAGLLFAAQKYTWRWKSITVQALLVLLSGISLHTWHAWADANYRTEVTSLTRYFPVFYPATGKRFFAKHGLTDPQALREQADLAAPRSSKHSPKYPVNEIQCSPEKNPMNILVILVDSLRYDVLNESLMPNLHEFSQQTGSMLAKEHFSGGNSTKAGVFSLFYGLPVSYWDAFTSAQMPPVLMDQLQEQGYEFKVLSSATLVSPSFDRNIFAGLKDVNLYTAEGTPWERDKTITKNWMQWLEQRSNAEQPFFGFLFYDAIHGYSVPPDFPRIEPYWENINHLALNKNFDATPFFNRYKTSVRYTDQLIGNLLKHLQEQNVLDSTIILVTSDHGEAFNEHGRNYWGHGSTYTREQVQVPLVMHWPKQEKQIAERRTSHADLPVTLMEEALGCHSESGSYSLGENLFQPFDQEWVMAGSYMGQGVLMPDYYVDVQPTGQYKIYNYQAKPLKDQNLPPKTAAEILEALSRFSQ